MGEGRTERLKRENRKRVKLKLERNLRKREEKNDAQAQHIEKQVVKGERRGRYQQGRKRKRRGRDRCAKDQRENPS